MAATPILALPYPIGTDRVADGDNAMQALAERIELVLPRGRLAYAETTLAQSGIPAAATDLTGLAFPLTLTTKRFVLLACALIAGPNVAGNWVSLQLHKDGAAVQAVNWPMPVAGAATYMAVSVMLTLPAATYAFKVRGAITLGSGTWFTGATPTSPGYLLATDYGLAP